MLTGSVKCVTSQGTTGAIAVADHMTLSTGETFTVPNLTVNGTVTGAGFFSNLFYCIGVVSGPSGSVLYTAGSTTYTVAHTSSTGVYTITFATAHPRGSNFPVIATTNTSGNTFCVAQITSSTVITVKTYAYSGGASDCQFSFQVFL